MSRRVKVSAWIGSATAIVTTLLALVVYSTDRAESAMAVAVGHEVRHVQTESDVKHIEVSMKENNEIVQSQLAAINAMSILTLKHVIKE